MSDDGQDLRGRGEECLALFQRGAEFTRELLRENEALRLRLARIEDQQERAARSPEDWSKLREELLARIEDLESESAGLRERLAEVELENRHFADRYLAIEEENDDLASLYVASYQLHSTLDIEEVLKIIIEIVINLVGGETFAVFLLDDRRDELRAVAAEGWRLRDLPAQPLAGSALGEAVLALEVSCCEVSGGCDPSQPRVCIPLGIGGQPVGAIAIHRLLQQKQSFSSRDHSLFEVLARHAASAILAAGLHAGSGGPSAIHGLIDRSTT